MISLFHFIACQAWGETWSMPLVVVSTDDIRGSVEKEIAESERVLKTAKKQKRGQQPAEAASAEPDANGAASTAVVLLDDDVFSIPSEDEPVRVSGSTGPQKAAKKAPKDDSAAQARKQQRERCAAWKKEVQKASGLLAMLTRCCTALEATTVRAVKNRDVVCPDLMEALEEAKKKNLCLKQRFSSIDRM